MSPPASEPTSLRSLIYSEKAQKEKNEFKFEFNSQDFEEEEEKVEDKLTRESESAEKTAAVNPITNLISTKYFFYNRKALNDARSNYALIIPFTRIRGKGSSDNDIDALKRKRELTEEYKKKNRSASKRKDKMRRITSSR